MEANDNICSRDTYDGWRLLVVANPSGAFEFSYMLTHWHFNDVFKGKIYDTQKEAFEAGVKRRLELCKNVERCGSPVDVIEELLCKLENDVCVAMDDARDFVNGWIMDYREERSKNDD